MRGRQNLASFNGMPGKTRRQTGGFGSRDGFPLWPLEGTDHWNFLLIIR